MTKIQLYIVILTLLFLTVFSVQAQEKLKLNVVYPSKSEVTVNAPTVFFIGSTNPDAKLNIKGDKTKIYPDGSFVKVINLKDGVNIITLKSILNGERKVLSYKITYQKEKTLPHKPLVINKGSIYPSQNILLQAGDKITISFKGSTGNKAYFSIGGKNYPMKEAPPKYINKAFKSHAGFVKGIYKGVYVIQTTDNYQNETVKVKLIAGKNSVQQVAAGSLTVLKAPFVGQIIKDKAVIRNAPDKERLTPLLKGTKIMITGKIGKTYRFNDSRWVNDNNVEILNCSLPQGIITNISAENDIDWTYIKIAQTEKQAFSINQLDDKIEIDFYNTKADTQYIKNTLTNMFIGKIELSNPSQDIFRVTLFPAKPQFWGYNYYYDNDCFVIALKNPPLINEDKPLDGKTVVIDPGHGGSESGAVGPTGVAEKNINLEISKYLKEYLEQEGAKVVMTRDADKSVEIYQRPEIAKNNNALILLSIHNNALPDGKNPYNEHGTSTYYFHQQSLPLAKSIQSRLKTELNLKDNGVNKSSFVLTRPTEQLSVLVEVAFMIHPEEYMRLKNPDFQKQSAKAIKDGVKDFLLINK